MNPQLTDSRWSDTQRAFLQALESAGANKPEYAVPIDRVPQVPARELQTLIDLGVVREAAANGYYIYPRATLRPPEVETLRPSQPLSALQGQFMAARLVKTIIFWLLIMLIPIVLIQMLGRH